MKGRYSLGDVYRDFFGTEDGKAEAVPKDGETFHGKEISLENGASDAKRLLDRISASGEELLKRAAPGAGAAAPCKDALEQANEALAETQKMLEEISRCQSGTSSFIKDSIGELNRMNGLAGDDVQGKPEPSQKNMDASKPQESADVTGALKAAAEAPEEDPFEQLDNLTGLTAIKHDVRELADFVSVQKLREDQGLKSVPVSKHLVFTGNPGTGKTTVARIIAKIYKKIGVLSKGQLVETDRSGLVAGYVGQTAIKTQEKISEALGGVLFIDEAYSLSQKDDAFGQEAVDTILKAMEDHRDDFVVIVAGYTKPMEKFINSNPGLKSRFNKYIEFPDYSVDELESIFFGNCRKYDYVVEEDAKKHIRELIVQAKLSETKNFANAREIRNMFEKIITNQARRIKKLENPSHEEMMTIVMSDLTDAEAGESGNAASLPGKKTAGGKEIDGEKHE